jgi:hypothetical protein
VSERGERAAGELRGRLDLLDQTLASVGDAEWTLLCAAEGWPLGTVVHHIARGLRRQRSWLEGDVPHDFSWEDTADLNATLAALPIVAQRPAVLALLRDERDAMLGFLEAADDAALDRIVFRFEGKERSADRVVRGIAARHIDEHHASIRGALEARA